MGWSSAAILFLKFSNDRISQASSTSDRSDNARMLIYFIHLGLDTSMETTKLSSQGQVIIPKSLRDAHHWEAGIELIAIDMGDGILLKPKKPFPETIFSRPKSSALAL